MENPRKESGRQAHSMPGPRRSGIFELRHHIFENLVQQVAELERIEGKRFIRLLRFAPCKSMHPVLCQNSALLK